MSDETLDSDQLRRRLHAAETPPVQALAMTPEEQSRLLKERASVLAREPEKPEDRRRLLEIVEFELAGERYGFELAQVREVCVLKDLTPVPCTPRFIFGIINLRGEIHTVLDLKMFFDLPASGITELNKVLIIEAGGMRVGILADIIYGVRTIPLNALQPSLPTLTGIRAEYLKGVTSERLIVLDAARILSDEALLVHEDAEG